MDFEQIIKQEFKKRGIQFDIINIMCNLYKSEQMNDNDLLEMISDTKIIAVNSNHFKSLQNELLKCENKNDFKLILKSLNNYENIYNRYFNEFLNNKELMANLHI